MNVRKRAVSSTPAMPMTRSRGNPLTTLATWAMASSGLLTTTITASGDRSATWRATEATILALVITRSSRDMPGLRATPLVMRTTSEPAVSS